MSQKRLMMSRKFNKYGAKTLIQSKESMANLKIGKLPLTLATLNFQGLIVNNLTQSQVGSK